MSGMSSPPHSSTRRSSLPIPIKIFPRWKQPSPHQLFPASPTNLLRPIHPAPLAQSPKMPRPFVIHQPQICASPATSHRCASTPLLCKTSLVLSTPHLANLRLASCIYELGDSNRRHSSPSQLKNKKARLASRFFLFSLFFLHHHTNCQPERRALCLPTARRHREGSQPPRLASQFSAPLPLATWSLACPEPRGVAPKAKTASICRGRIHFPISNF
jgi:hypothetical protein